jgi:hypothetical protein
MSEEKKSEDTKSDDELAEGDMEKVAGGVSVGTLQVRGGGNMAALAKIGDDVGTISEFVPKLTAG